VFTKLTPKWGHVERLERGWAFQDAFPRVPSRYGYFLGTFLQEPLYYSNKVIPDDDTLFLVVEIGKVTAFGRTRTWMHGSGRVEVGF
jgi:hypothetical protein